jgi:hypothetical protein
VPIVYDLAVRIKMAFRDRRTKVPQRFIKSLSSGHHGT